MMATQLASFLSLLKTTHLDGSDILKILKGFEADTNRFHQDSTGFGVEGRNCSLTPTNQGQNTLIIKGIKPYPA
jgi:hypothetical protein